MLNDNEVKYEDVVMKLFVYSLFEDARDWFKRLPDYIIGSIGSELVSLSGFFTWLNHLLWFYKRLLLVIFTFLPKFPYWNSNLFYTHNIQILKYAA